MKIKEKLDNTIFGVTSAVEKNLGNKEIFKKMF